MKEQDSSTESFDSCIEIINDDTENSDVIEKKLSGNLNIYQGSKTNNVCVQILKKN